MSYILKYCRFRTFGQEQFDTVGEALDWAFFDLDEMRTSPISIEDETGKIVLDEHAIFEEWIKKT